MSTAHDHDGAHGSLLAQHAGHLSILVAWLVIFGVVLARQKLPMLRLRVRPLQPGVGTVSMAGGLVLVGGAEWVMIGRHVTSTTGSVALVALSVAQLFVAGLVATRPSDLLIRGVATACVAIGLWSVLSGGLTGSTTELPMVDILAFSAQLGTAGCGWLILSRAPVLS